MFDLIPRSARTIRSACAGAARCAPLIAAVILAAIPGAPAHGQALPPGFGQATLTAELSFPTCLAVAPDGRIFVGLKDGVVRIWKPGFGLLATPFHTTPVDGQGERGLIGIALAPGFATSGRVYLHVSRPAPNPRAEIIHVTAASAGADVANPATETLLFSIGSYGAATNHAGGAIRFGPDHKLYIGVGENAVQSNAQSLANLFGKVLRINADGTIPGDNPATIDGLGAPAGQNRAIWAAGLRNPFTLAFQPGTGRLFINDVGGGAFEEIDDGGAGNNYGWPATEGPFNQGSFPNFTHPLNAYPHTGAPVSGRCIVGGAFYNPPVHTFPPEYRSDYFFGDAVTGWIRRRDAASGAILDFVTGVWPVNFDLDAQGHLLYITHEAAGKLIRIAWNCYVNCDASTAAPALNIGDFACFLNAFAGGNPYANCDASTTAPTLNINDFSCFLARFSQGCP